jgi:AAA15 family ATPase/GTPase
MSYSDEQEFNMIPSKCNQYPDRIISNKSAQDLLNFSVLYGANASGKSNLTKAIALSKKIITNGISNSNIQHYWCKLDEKNKKEDSKFEYDFIVNQKTFSYGFMINLFDLEIKAEWLFEIKGEKIEQIFHRMNDESYANEKYFENNFREFAVYLNDIKNTKNKLLLTEISEKNKTEKEYEIFNEAFNWFQNKLQIVFPDSDTFPLPKLFSDEGKGDNIMKLLKYFQTGITNYNRKILSKGEVDKLIPHEILNQIVLDLKNRRSKSSNASMTNLIFSSRNKMIQLTYLDDIGEFKAEELLFYHNDEEKISFSLEEESDGTKRLIQLMGLIDNLNDNKVFIVDELDRSLHPLLVCQFVDTFLNLAGIKKSKSQLFITSHQTTLLDLDLLRGDEIWFVKKRRDNSSSLYRLSQFKKKRKIIPKEDESGKVKFSYKEEVDSELRNDYLLGRYGGIPDFKSFAYLNRKLTADIKDVSGDME